MGICTLFIYYGYGFNVGTYVVIRAKTMKKSEFGGQT